MNLRSKNTFAVLNQMVADGAIENYAVAGAVGAMFYIEPCSTKDPDIFVTTPLHKEAYASAQTLNVEEVPVRVARPEHLVAIMLKVGRPKDLARVVMFLSQDAVKVEALEDVINRHDLSEKWLEYKRQLSK